MNLFLILMAMVAVAWICFHDDDDDDDDCGGDDDGGY